MWWLQSTTSKSDVKTSSRAWWWCGTSAALSVFLLMCTRRGDIWDKRVMTACLDERLGRAITVTHLRSETRGHSWYFTEALWLNNTRSASLHPDITEPCWPIFLREERRAKSLLRGSTQNKLWTAEGEQAFNYKIRSLIEAQHVNGTFFIFWIFSLCIWMWDPVCVCFSHTSHHTINYFSSVHFTNPSWSLNGPYWGRDKWLFLQLIHALIFPELITGLSRLMLRFGGKCRYWYLRVLKKSVNAI